MRRLFVKSIELEKTKGWDETWDIEIKKNHILVIAHFAGKGNLTWYPRYQDLREILGFLVLLHGEEEVRTKVLEDVFVNAG